MTTTSGWIGLLGLAAGGVSIGMNSLFVSTRGRGDRADCPHVAPRPGTRRAGRRLGLGQVDLGGAALPRRGGRLLRHPAWGRRQRSARPGRLGRRVRRARGDRRGPAGPSADDRGRHARLRRPRRRAGWPRRGRPACRRSSCCSRRPTRSAVAATRSATVRCPPGCWPGSCAVPARWPPRSWTRGGTSSSRSPPRSHRRPPPRPPSRDPPTAARHPPGWRCCCRSPASRGARTRWRGCATSPSPRTRPGSPAWRSWTT